MSHPPGVRYPNAPIAEAVMDVQVEMPVGFEADRLGLFSDPAYTGRDETVELRADIEQGALGVTTRTARRVSGYRFATPDRHAVVLMRDNGFSFGQVAPYDRWVTFSAEGLRLWAEYVELAHPLAATRLGLRYINQIVLPDGAVDLARFLRTRPEISDDMPTMTAGFFMSMDIPLPEYGAVCRITESLIDTAEGARAVALDIDVNRTSTYDPRSTAAIVETFEALRNAKNAVFEASITDESRRLFG